MAAAWRCRASRARARRRGFICRRKIKPFAKSRPRPGRRFARHGNGLVVDDENVLLTMAETVLSEYGYCVVTANSGQKALAILARRRASGFDHHGFGHAGMSGRELIERVRQARAGHADHVHQRLRDAGGQANRHAVFAETVHEPELLAKVKQVATANRLLTNVQVMFNSPYAN
jgi:CheY-like chemotaxis protein